MALSDYLTEVAADSVGSLWDLQETSGTNANDSGSFSHDGTYTNTPVLDSGGPFTGVTSALFASASSEYVSIGDFADYSPAGSDFSVEVWARMTTTGAVQKFVSKDGNSSGTREWALQLSAAGVPGWTVYDTGTGAYLDCAGNFTVRTNTWYHFVGVYDSLDDSALLYCNGALIAQDIISAGAQQGDTATGVAIGTRSSTSTGSFANAKLMLAAYYPSALTQDRVLAHYEALFANLDSGAYPTVEATATSDSGSSTSTHTVDLPTGIQAGEMLVVGFGISTGNVSIDDTTDGWAVVAEMQEGGTTVRGTILYRIADGTESSTMTITTSSATNSAHVAYRISDHDGMIPYFHRHIDYAGSWNDLFAHHVEPFPGEDDYLWLDFAFVDSSAGLISAAPEGYTGFLNSEFSGVGTYAAQRNVTANSYGASQFALSSAEQACVANIAIRSGGQSTYPQVRGWELSRSDSNVTSHTLNLPASIESGDRLIASFTIDQEASSIVITWPAGWTEFDSAADGSTVKTSLASRVADGSESGSITVATDATCKSSHCTLDIRNAGGVLDSNSINGSSTSANPPSLTPGTTENFLWLIFGGHESGNTRIDFETSWPEQWVGRRYTVSSTNTTFSCGAWVGWRPQTIATLDPAIVTLSASEPWTAFTVVVNAPVTIDVNQASETDTGLSVVRNPVARLINIASETDEAQNLALDQFVSVGLASETDLAQIVQVAVEGGDEVRLSPASFLPIA